MRTNKLILLLVCLFLGFQVSVQAQDDKKSQAFWIHEDVVKPSMVGEYEKVCKELVDNMKKHNIQDANWITANSSDSRYFYIGPIENMAALDKPVFATLSAKMGKEAMGNLFGRMSKCYDVEHDYVIHLDNELSYMPEGMTQTPEGQNYRKWHYLYLSPENSSLIKEKMMVIRNMFAEKNSKVAYRVYKSGFGARGEFYLVSVAAKDPVDYAQRTAENDALFGEEGKQKFQDLFSNLLNYEEYTGYMRPDLAYSPQPINNKP